MSLLVLLGLGLMAVGIPEFRRAVRDLQSIPVIDNWRLAVTRHRDLAALITIAGVVLILVAISQSV